LPPDPLTLAFDTSAAHCAAALLSGDLVLAERCEEMAKGQAERLFVLLEELLAEAGHTWKDLNRIGVGIGPGNFTGIRISVSSARGLALSLGVPAIGVSTFQALALGAKRPVLSIIEAPAQRTYVQRFETGASHGPQILSEPLIPATLLAGNANIVSTTANANAAPRHSIAVAIGLIAASTDASKAPRPAPLYMRAADAAPPRDAPPTILL
jgi:tRNA threonylcarbamoyladenosine biosynthesis protein TsaB